MLSRPYPTPQLPLPTRPTAVRVLLALARTRPWLVTGACALGALWLVPGALLPLIFGAAVDTGIAGHDSAALLSLAALVVVVGLAQAAFGAALNFLGHGMWIHGATGIQRAVAGHAARLGASLRAQARTGEVMAISSSDINYIGNAFEVVGRLAGAIAAFLVVGLALLTISPLLATIALVGVPLAVLGIGPLVARLQHRQAAKREQLAEVNALGADIVSGLRVLRGIGGERQFLVRFRAASRRVRRAGIEASRSESWLAGAEVVLPGLVTVAVTWLGARLAVAGTVSAGELVTFYGACAFLVIPVSTATEAAHAFTAGWVAARKASRVLSMRPSLTDPAEPVALPAGPLELHDTATGITVVAGKLTVLDLPTGGEAIAGRLARFTDPEPGQQALLSGVSASRVALAQLRRRVVYARHDDVWFSGVLGDEITPPEPTPVGLTAALWAADADDIVAALPAGLAELIGERGREVSGGQRQRLNLARALALDADVLLLDEPTSAVDAHTEARITERVAKLRQGRTTVVFSHSPLWAGVADDVVREATPCR